MTVKLNFECACTEEMLAIACQIGPHDVLLVPENRQEITTEGGLNVVAQKAAIAAAADRLHAAGIKLSLFVDPDPKQIEASAAVHADAVEIHTGSYAHAATVDQREHQLSVFRRACEAVVQFGLDLHAGHGLTYSNVRPIALMADVRELNIGHSIISRAVMVGMIEAVRDMKRLVTSSDE